MVLLPETTVYSKDTVAIKEMAIRELPTYSVCTYIRTQVRSTFLRLSSPWNIISSSCGANDIDLTTASAPLILNATSVGLTSWEIDYPVPTSWNIIRPRAQSVALWLHRETAKNGCISSNFEEAIRGAFEIVWSEMG